MIDRKRLVVIMCISLVWSASGILLNKSFPSQTDDLNIQETINSADPSVRVVYKTSACTIGDFYYSTIQSAVNAATDGDSIIVCPGTYVENIKIEYKNSLNIKSHAGQEITTVDASSKTYPGFAVGSANYVNISGFTIMNAFGDYGRFPNAGIFFLTVNHATISDNDILSNQHGIWLGYSTYNTIENSNIRSNNCPENNCSGLWLHDSSNYNTIRYNTIIGNDYGIYLDDDVTPCIDNIISYNNFTGNDYGLRIKGLANKTVITCNNFRGNQYHIYLCPGASPSVGNVTVQYNNFFDRGQYTFYNNQSADVIATYNWWGTTNETLIEQLIYDKNDNPECGKVFYKPYLTSPSTIEIVSVNWSPAEPTSNDFVKVEANVTEVGDADEVDKVLFSFKDCFDQWWSTPMTYNSTSGLWTTTMPAQPGNVTAEFFLTAYDKAGNTHKSGTYTYTVKSLIPGDIDGDGRVSYKDLFILAANYGKKDS